jgi:hypothetical protein
VLQPVGIHVGNQPVGPRRPRRRRPQPAVLLVGFPWPVGWRGTAESGRGLYDGGPVSRVTYSRVWRAARKAALTATQYASPLARTTCGMPARPRS